jgi:hypothetical protein
VTRYVPIPKPRTVKKLRTKPRAMSAKRRKEQKIVAQVFKEIEPRDGRCRIARLASWDLSQWLLVGACEGEPQPAHIGQWRRAFTRGWPPELRHNRRTIARICRGHHRRYDLHEYDVEYDATYGAEAGMRVVPHVSKGAA